MEMNILLIACIALLALLLFIVLAELMIYFAQQDNPAFFSITFIVMHGFDIVLYAFIFTWMVSALPIVIAASVIGIIAILTMLYVTSLYQQAGENQRAWFYLTLLFPILAIVYQVTKQ